jgi:hypothetical protein
VKPLPRYSHVSVTTGDRIIMFVSLLRSPSPLITVFCRFGGYGKLDGFFNDIWSFDISTRKWTELRYTGSIPSPRHHHAAVLIDDVMYVFGGLASRGTYLGDLTALNLSSKWFGCWSSCARSHTISSSAMDRVSRHRTKSTRKVRPCYGL